MYQNDNVVDNVAQASDASAGTDETVDDDVFEVNPELALFEDDLHSNVLVHIFIFRY